MSMYHIPNYSGSHNLNNSNPSYTYNDDESGFYDSLKRIPPSYYSKSRQDFKLAWPKISYVRPKYVFLSIHFFFFLMFLLSVPKTEDASFLVYFLSISMATLTISLGSLCVYMLVVYLVFAAFKYSHKSDFANVSVTDLYALCKIVRNRIHAYEPKLFAVPSSLKLNPVTNRPNEYNHLPPELRSKTRYEFRKSWGRTVVFSDLTLLPMIFFIGFWLYLLDESVIGSLSFILISILAYKIPGENSLKVLSKKYFAGIEVKEAKKRITAVRKFVNGVDPNLFQRIWITVKTRSQKTTQHSSLQVSNTIQSSPNPPAPHQSAAHSWLNYKLSFSGLIASLSSAFRNNSEVDMVRIDPNSVDSMSSQYLSHILEYERRMGLR